MLKRTSPSSFLRSSKSRFFYSSSPILLARKEDEEAARQWKLPSFLTNFLDKTAPAHLRGTYLTEAKDLKAREEEMEKKKQEAEIAKSKRKSAATQAAKVSFTAEERGFVKGGKSRSAASSSSSASTADEKKQSQDKYGVNWSNEEIDSAESAKDDIGSNLPRSKQMVGDPDEDEATATDFLAGTQKVKEAQKQGAVPLGKKKEKKKASVFNRAWETLKMTREDASAVRDEDATEAENIAKGLRDDELQTGKYFKRLHGTSLKSWTKQCFTRLPDVEEAKLHGVEVEVDENTDIVTVFVTAENLTDKQLTAVKHWVEAICPVTKARDKLIQRMEDEDRRRQSHVLASSSGPTGPASRMTTPGGGAGRKPGSSRIVQDPLKQFAKRRNIRWIRIDPDS